MKRTAISKKQKLTAEKVNFGSKIKIELSEFPILSFMFSLSVD
jgi:hypothetical protein